MQASPDGEVVACKCDYRILSSVPRARGRPKETAHRSQEEAARPRGGVGPEGALGLWCPLLEVRLLEGLLRPSSSTHAISRLVWGTLRVQMPQPFNALRADIHILFLRVACEGNTGAACPPEVLGPQPGARALGAGVTESVSSDTCGPREGGRCVHSKWEPSGRPGQGMGRMWEVPTSRDRAPGFCQAVGAGHRKVGASRGSSLHPLTGPSHPGRPAVPPLQQDSPPLGSRP